MSGSLLAFCESGGGDGNTDAHDVVLIGLAALDYPAAAEDEVWPPGNSASFFLEGFLM